MAVTVLSAQSSGGPRGGSTWYDEGFAGAVGFPRNGATVAATSTLEQATWMAPTPNLVVQPGDTYPFVLAQDNVIQALYGVYVTPDAAWGANIANLTIQFVLRRGGAVVGGGAFAGWPQAGNPAFVPYAPTYVPFLVANTALLPGRLGRSSTGPGPGQAFLPLQPLDVVTVQFVNSGGAAITLPSVLNVYLVCV